MAGTMNDYGKEQKAIKQIEEEVFDSIIDYNNYSSFKNKSIKLTDSEDDLLYFDVKFEIEGFGDIREIDFLVRVDVGKEDLFFSYNGDAEYEKVRCFKSEEFQKMLFFKALES